MSMLRSARNNNTVTGIEYLRAVVEFDLELTLEDISDMTTFTPMRFHVWAVFNEAEPPLVEGEDLVANSIHRKRPVKRVEVTSVFHSTTSARCLTVSA